MKNSCEIVTHVVAAVSVEVDGISWKKPFRWTRETSALVKMSSTPGVSSAQARAWADACSNEVAASPRSDLFSLRR